MSGTGAPEGSPPFGAIDWEMCAPKLRGGLIRWVESGVYPGSFLRAVLANDLHEAVVHADRDSLAGIRSLVLFVYNELPSQAWGSAEKCKKWHESKKQERESS